MTTALDGSIPFIGRTRLRPIGSLDGNAAASSRAVSQ